MKLEDQVISLELAKKLKELGVKQDSLFWWSKQIGRLTLEYKNYFAVDKRQDYSAFTVAELGEMLPTHHNYGEFNSGKCNGGSQYICSYIHWGNYIHDKDKYETEKLNKSFIADTEADARAKMLVYLLENKLIKL